MKQKFKHRYYLDSSFHRDGSSRLSSNNRWGNFWSVSDMWNISNKAFMKPVKKVLNDLKIRASYGINGNQPNSLYGYIGLYSYGQKQHSYYGDNYWYYGDCRAMDVQARENKASGKHVTPHYTYNVLATDNLNITLPWNRPYQVIRQANNLIQK